MATASMPDGRARYRHRMNATSTRPQLSATPDRVPLARLARRRGQSPALARVLLRTGTPGPARVAVAAFQSSV